MVTEDDKLATLFHPVSRGGREGEEVSHTTQPWDMQKNHHHHRILTLEIFSVTMSQSESQSVTVAESRRNSHHNDTKQ